MSYKLLVSFCLAFFLSSLGYTQIRVGTFDVAMYKHGKLNTKTSERFKSKTTKFILPRYREIAFRGFLHGQHKSKSSPTTLAMY